MTANGRFVVFLSNGDVATQNRNNADGNLELFLIDYAQRRIFQITNTKSVPKTGASPSPTPTPTPTPSPTASPTPTPTPIPTPEDPTTLQIQIENRSPMISLNPQLVDGARVYTIVFSSNAPSPGNFDGTAGSLATDANQEIWIYRLPPVTDVDLTLGADLPLQPLDNGSFFQVTKTQASRPPTPGQPATTTSAAVSPFYADDNREAAISDDGNILAFTSTRDLVPAVGNADGNPELFFYNIAADAFVQGTNTRDAIQGVGFVFQQNPSLSADGSVVAFVSSANLAGSNNDSNGTGNAEVFVGNFSGAGLSNVRQVTRTKIDVASCSVNSTTTPNCANVNVLSPGRRLSRDGSLIAFESLATDPKANNTTNNFFFAVFVYTVASDTFVQIGQRATTFPGDIVHFPTFTDYSASLAPASLVFASALNFRADGTFPAAAQTAEGLNPLNSPQIFLTQLPASSSNTFVRMTNTPAVTTFGGTRPMTSESRKRMSFALGGVDLGGGNADGSIEIFYLLSPQVTAQSAAVLTFFTGASNMPVATATPVPSPTPSPTPTPSPSPGVALGLAPGELSIVTSTVDLAPSTATSPPSSETDRSPALPIELNGVSLGVNGAAAGLYFVGSGSQKQITFVMPRGLATGLGNVVVNILNSGANTDTALHGLVQIVAGQPDIFTDPPGGAGGTAVAFNTITRAPSPFNVTTTDSMGNTAPTVVELSVTGVRLATTAEITVTVGTTVLSGTAIGFVGPNPNMPGLDFINFTLPATLMGAGNVPVIVTFTRSGLVTVSRPADTAPRITIN